MSTLLVGKTQRTTGFFAEKHNMSWYKKSFLTIEHIATLLPEIKTQVMAINGVNGLYVWGSYLSHKNNPEDTIKDLDIIASTDFFSEDFFAITDDEQSPLKLVSSRLEDLGYDPELVQFTKDFLSLDKYNIDHWAISNDGKILHWGPVIEDQDEWKSVKTEAEKYASFEMGIKGKMPKKSNYAAKGRWYVLYDHHVNHYLKDMPRGWNSINCNFKKIEKHLERL